MNNWSANASGLRFLVQRDKIIRINWSADARKVVGPQQQEQLFDVIRLVRTNGPVAEKSKSSFSSTFLADLPRITHCKRTK